MLCRAEQRPELPRVCPTDPTAPVRVLNDDVELMDRLAYIETIIIASTFIFRLSIRVSTFDEMLTKNLSAVFKRLVNSVVCASLLMHNVSAGC